MIPKFDVSRRNQVPNFLPSLAIQTQETKDMDNDRYIDEPLCRREATPFIIDEEMISSDEVSEITHKIRWIDQLRVVLVNRLLFFVYVVLVGLNLYSMDPGGSASLVKITVFEMLLGCTFFLMLELVLQRWRIPDAVTWHTRLLTLLNVALYSRLVVTSGTMASEIFFMGCLMSLGIMHQSTITLAISLLSSLGIAAFLYSIAPRQDALLVICQLLLLGTVMSLLIHFFRRSSMEIIEQFIETTQRQTKKLRQMVDQTRRNEERQRSISEALPLGMVEINTNGLVMYGNRYLQDLFPHFAWDDLNQPILWSEMVHPEYRQEAERNFNQAKNANRFFLGEYCSSSMVDQGQVWIRFRLKLVNLPEETLYIGTVENITCRKQIEQELMRYAEELRFSKEQEEAHARNLSLLVDELAESRQRAEESTRTKSEFLANMSHEIRTPMTAILDYTDVVLEENHAPEVAEYLSTIKRNGEYLLNLINDILDLSKIEAGKMDIELIESSPALLVEEIISLLRNRAEEKGLTFTATFEGDIPNYIYTDPVRLRQILVNLLGNAIKFTEQGEVEIFTRLVWSTTQMQGLDLVQRQAHLEFRIKDSGIGMKPSQLGNLFQPFTQADNSMTRRFGGTGLGLAISKRLSNMLGGDIQVTSEYGAGSEFLVTISAGDLTDATMEPVKNIRYQPHQVATRSTEQKHVVVKLPPVTTTNGHQIPATTKIPPGRCRVLLAEDGLDNQRLLTFLLKKAGCYITVVDNGQAAIEELQTSLILGELYDVVLMDMQMPIMDGYTATRTLRELGFELPIIALTAHAMTGDRDKCLTAGCSEYLTKPVDKKRLIELINESSGRAIEAKLA